jgi:thiol:disulfide interchange protein
MVGTIPALIASEEVQWSKSIQESMSEAKTTGKPMMMDFYTDW